MQVSGIHARVERATVWDPGCAAGVAGCNEAELGDGHWRQPSQVIAFSAMVSPLFAGPKVTGLTESGLKPPKP